MDEVAEFIQQAQVVEWDKAALTRCLKSLDLTSLNDDDDASVIQALCSQVLTPFGQVASVCVLPNFIAQARSALVLTPSVTVTSVANFPSGNHGIDDSLSEIYRALQRGAQEIDVVFPYQRYMQGDAAFAQEFVRACKSACGPLVLKVILEVGALQDVSYIQAATRDAVFGGADFIKTSTGKIAQGATLESVAAILMTLKELQSSGHSVGCKISGGIRHAWQALEYLNLIDLIMGPQWASPKTLRFGASSLLIDLMEKIDNAAD